MHDVLMFFFGALAGFGAAVVLLIYLMVDTVND